MWLHPVDYWAETQKYFRHAFSLISIYYDKKEFTVKVCNFYLVRLTSWCIFTRGSLFSCVPNKITQIKATFKRIKEVRLLTFIAPDIQRCPLLPYFSSHLAEKESSSAGVIRFFFLTCFVPYDGLWCFDGFLKVLLLRMKRHALEVRILLPYPPPFSHSLVSCFTKCIMMASDLYACVSTWNPFFFYLASSWEPLEQKINFCGHNMYYTMTIYTTIQFDRFMSLKIEVWEMAALRAVRFFLLHSRFRRENIFWRMFVEAVGMQRNLTYSSPCIICL